MSYLDLLNIKYKFKLILIFISIFFIGILIYVLNLKVCDRIESFAYKEKGLVITRLIIDTPDTINSLKYILIGNKKYKATIDKYGDYSLDKDNLVNFQDVYFKVDGNIKEGQVFRIAILYNEEKVYKKLKKMLF